MQSVLEVIFMEILREADLNWIKLFNITHNGLEAQGKPGIGTLQMDQIDAFNNSLSATSMFFAVPANISLRNSRFNSGSSGVLIAYPQLIDYTYIIAVENCSFSDMGVGVQVQVTAARSFDVSISSCLFYASSQAHPCPSINLASSPSQSENVKQMVTIRSVVMEGTLGGPLLVLHSIQMVLLNEIIIRNNQDTALYLKDSSVLFRGNNAFSNNSANTGGGISVIGNSYIFVDTDSTLEIINNTAYNLGGGIFVQKIIQTESWVNDYCFLQLSFSVNPKVVFHGNRAELAGADLYMYGGSIETCRQMHGPYERLSDTLDLFTNALECRNTDVSSDAIRIALCDEDLCINTTRNETLVQTYPGTQISVMIAAVGQLDGITQANVR